MKNFKNSIILLPLVLAACGDVTVTQTSENPFGNDVVSQDGTAIEQLNFADSTLESCIDSTATANGWTEIDQFSSLTCNDSTITTLSGLEQLTSVTQLVLQRADLTTDAVQILSEMTQLTALDLNDNQISSIAFVSTLTELEGLFLSGNTLTSLNGGSNSSRQLAKSQNVDAANSSVSALANLTKLRILHLNSSNISDISALADLTALELLEVSDNDITDLTTLSSLTALTTLNIARNQVSDLTALGNLTNLEILQLAGNNVTNISALDALTALTELDLEGNDVSDLTPLSALTTIENLNLKNNENLTDLTPLTNLVELEELDISGTLVADISPIKNAPITDIVLPETPITCVGCTDVDTDGDGVPDIVEVIEGTSPTDGTDFRNENGNNIPDWVEENVNDTAPVWDTLLSIVSTESSGDADWSVVDVNTTPNYWQSGDISDSESTTFTIVIDAKQASSFEFDVHVSSEKSYDILTGTLNGNDLGSWSGEIKDEGIVVVLDEGTNTFVFTYRKDSNTSRGRDFVSVVMPNTAVEEIELIEGSADIPQTSTASDAEGNAITYTLLGVDSNEFSVDDNGQITFNAPPQFAFPADANADNTYELVIVASDGKFDSELSVVISVVKDTDGDGVPDNVETEDGTDVNLATSYLDIDHDLVPDYVEYVNGTDPLNQASFLDADESGYPDYFENNYLGTGDAPEWILANPGGNVVINSLANGVTDVAYGDMDGDNDLDIVSVSRNNNQVVWYENGNEWLSHTVSSFANLPAQVRLGDMDNDNDLDIVVASEGADAVYWFENGNSWLQTTIVTNIFNPLALELADMNEDGLLDVLVVGSSTGDVAFNWYENGNDWHDVFITTVRYVSDIHVVDFDGDDDLDIFLAQRNDSNQKVITYLSNDGNSTSFGSSGDILSTVVANLAKVKVADINGDGNLDVLSFDSAGLFWWDNDSSNNSVFELPAMLNVVDVVLGDLDNDGDVDVTTVSQSGSLTRFINNGANQDSGIEWEELTTVSPLSRPTDLELADLNADGAVDILYTDSTFNRVSVFFSDSGAVGSVVSGNHDVDYDDYAQDVDTIAYRLSGPDAELMTIDGVGQISFIQAPVSSDPQDANDDGVYQVTIHAFDNENESTLDLIIYVRSDVDGDGVPGDIEALQNTDDNDSNSYLDSDGDTVPDYIEWLNDTDANDATNFADEDNDGVSDYIEIFSTPAAPTFIGSELVFGSTDTISDDSSGVFGVTYGDVDGDGDQDIIAALKDSNSVVWYENGNNWQKNIITSAADGAQSVVAHDFDNDGDLDVAAALNVAGELVWYENTGLNNWSEDTIQTGLTSIYSVTLADLNKDGHMDLLVSTYGLNQINWYQNSGSGTFTSRSIGTVAGARSAVAGDIDADGDMDVFAVSFLSDTVYLIQSNSVAGTSWFSPVEVLASSTLDDGATDIALGDIDGDGDLDVVYAAFNSDSIAWYETGNANVETNISVTADGVHDIELADIDQDGDLDVVAALYLDDKVVWYENGNDWLEHVVDNAISSPYSIALGDVTDNGVLNIIAGANASDEVLLYNASIPAETALNLEVVEGLVNVSVNVEVNDVNGNDLTYSIDGTDSALLTIDEITGALRFVNVPEFSSPDDINNNNDYVITLIVSDGELFSELDVTINVLSDMDGDLVPDTVEVEQGTSTNNMTSFLDTDADGVPDYVEMYIDHSDYNDANSYLDLNGNDVSDYSEMFLSFAPQWQNDLEEVVTEEILSIVEGASIVNYTSVIVDEDDDIHTIEIANGLDSDDFEFTSKGLLSFSKTISFDNPDDFNLDNEYSIVLVASDEDGESAALSLFVTVLEDSDGDLVPNEIEIIDGTDANNASSYLDTDNDEVPDYVEINIDGTDETDETSFVDVDNSGTPDYSDVREFNSAPTWTDVSNYGEFEAIAIDEMLSSADDIQAADMDGDGDIDLVAASSESDSIYWYENGNNWNRTLVTNAATNVQSIRLVDTDSDSDVDILYLSDTSGVRILENGNDWASTLVSDNSGYSLAVGHLDDDGFIDVLIADVDVDTVFAKSETDGWVEQWTWGATDPMDVELGDMDNDGDLDIVVAANGLGEIYLWENGADWAETLIQNFQGGVYDLALADINDDGALDVVSVNRDTNSVQWFDSADNWQFNSITTNLTNAQSVDTADVDGDGDLDVVVATGEAQTMRWFENGNDWSETTFSDALVIANRVVVADIDQDGVIEILATSNIGNSASSVKLFKRGELLTDVSTEGVDHVEGTSEVLYISEAFDEDELNTLSYSLSGIDASLFEVDSHGVLHFLSAPTYSDVASENDYILVLTVTDGTEEAELDLTVTVIQDTDGDLVPDSVEVLQNTDVNDATDYLDSDLDGVPDYVEMYIDGTDSNDVLDFLDEDANGTPDYLDAHSEALSIEWHSDYPSMWEVDSITTSADGVHSIAYGDVDGDNIPDVVSASIIDGTIDLYLNNGSWGHTLIATPIATPQSVKLEDIDGDNDLDVVSVSSTGGVYWYENGNSWSETTISTNVSQPQNVELADIDNDGDLDVFVTSNLDHSIRWFENGSAWSETVITDSYSGAHALKLADMDGDGDIDVVATSPNLAKISWFENGNAWGRTDIADLASPYDLDVADFDLDGDIDVVVKGNSVNWYENGNNWSSTTIEGSVSANKIGIAVYDIDANGTPDVITSSQADKIYWYSNRNDGVTWAETPFVTPNDTISDIRDILVADFNNDGVVDVLTASASQDSVKLYSGNSTPLASLDVKHVEGLIEVYQTAYLVTDSDSDVTYTLAGDDVALFDVSSDGVISFKSSPVYGTNLDTGSNGYYEVTVVATIGQSKDELRLIINVLEDTDEDLVPDDVEEKQGTNINDGMSYLDSDGDSVPDYFEVFFDLTDPNDSTDFIDSDDDGVSDYRELNSGADDAPVWKSTQGDFSESTSYSSGDGVMDLAYGDLDGDGDLDLVTASEFGDYVGWLENLGDGSFADEVIIGSNLDQAFSVNIADIDGDGDNDVVSASRADDKIVWFANDGSGVFGSEQTISLVMNGATSAYPADIDNDGDIDIVAGSYLDESISWFRNNGSGIFSSEIGIVIGLDNYKLDVGDIDGDGDLDVISTDNNAHNVYWFSNDGSGVFASQGVIYSNGELALDTHLEDLDLDGDLDVLVVSTGNNQLAILENIGNGAFATAVVQDTTLSNPRDVFTSDLDGDGYPEILVASQDNSEVVWYGNGGSIGQFTSKRVLSGTTTNPRSVIAADFDGDGDNDIVSANYGADNITVFLSKELETTSKMLVHTEGLTDVELLVDGFDADGDDLTYNLYGLDAGLFDLSEQGELTFTTAPDYDNPMDLGTNNSYQVNIGIDDGNTETVIELVIFVVESNE